jgi:hypothetical protein
MIQTGYLLPDHLTYRRFGPFRRQDYKNPAATAQGERSTFVDPPRGRRTALGQARSPRRDWARLFCCAPEDILAKLVLVLLTISWTDSSSAFGNVAIIAICVWLSIKTANASDVA